MDKNEIKSKFLSGEIDTYALTKHLEIEVIGFSFLDEADQVASNTNEYWKQNVASSSGLSEFAMKRDDFNEAQYNTIDYSSESPQEWDFLRLRIQKARVKSFVYLNNEWWLSCLNGPQTMEQMQSSGDDWFKGILIRNEGLRLKNLVV
jgi:hypothetical protein